MQQFFQNQMKLLENLTNNVANMQAQANNPPQSPPQQPAPMNRHREFMSHRPPVFTHAADPLDADDWLKTVGNMLTTAQCDDREKVLFAAGRLQGSARAWWDAYTTAHAAPDTITWQEFTESFRNHHIPAGVMRLKKEFLSLKQGGCQWQSTETGSSCCLAMYQRRLLMILRSRSASWRVWLDRSIIS
jgi:hypothetical protein